MRKQVLGGRQEGGLIVFDGDNRVSPLFVEKLLHGFILGMQGVGFDQAPVQIETIDQLARRSDFIGLVRHGLDSQTTQGRNGDGGD